MCRGQDGLEGLQWNATAEQVWNNPEIKGPLREPCRFLDLQEKRLDVVHSFLAIHRSVTPDETLTRNTILITLPLDGRTILAIPELRSIKIGANRANEVHRLANGFGG